MHRLFRYAQQGADLGPAQPGLAPAAHRDFLPARQLLSSLSNRSQFPYNPTVVVRCYHCSHIVSIR
jgi:hypothetical protein